MKVLICLTFVLALVCVSQASFLNKRLQSTLVNTIDIPAGQSVTQNNPLPMDIKTSCQIQTSSPNPITICNTPVAGTISINGQALTQQTCFNNTNGETFTLTLSKSSTLKLTNQGNYDVKSVCTLELQDILKSGLTNTIDIPAGQSVSQNNPLPMDIKTSCQIQTTSPGPIEICNTPVAGTITINGQSLTQQTCFNNTNGETFTLTLSKSSTLKLTNQGNYDVKSVCTLETGLKQKSIMFIDQKYTIKAGQNSSITNPMPFSLSTDCTVSGLNGATDKCCVYGAKGTTTQNGQALSPTTPICTENVGDNSVWKYTLTNGAEILVNNQGNYDFTIDCVLNTLTSDYI